MADNFESLSLGDALFLHLERDEAPLHIASVGVFEGVITMREFTRFLQWKLPLIPRFRQRVEFPLLNLGMPSWQDDPDFDLRKHLQERTLTEGTEEEFKDLAGQVLSVPMDRARPLWDVTLVHGLKGAKRTGAIIRIHHCLADGVSGLKLLNILMDPAPVPLPSGKLPNIPVSPSNASQKTLLEGLVSTCLEGAEQLLSLQAELLNMGAGILALASKQQKSGVPGSKGTASDRVKTPTPADITELLPELAAPAERLPFNVVCHGPQKFNWAEISLAEIKEIKNACGTTVNDVVLTLITATLRRYAELHQVNVRRRMLKIIVPVNVRGEDGGQLGNRITFLPLPLPLGMRDPRNLLTEVARRMGLLKGARVAELVGFAGSFIGFIPTALQALIAPIASQLPLSVCNVICTNVPGPQFPLYLFGHKMLSCYPRVPIGGEMGMNCAVLTYNGVAYFGFTGDAQAIPDLESLERCLLESFEELRKASGTKKRREAKPRAKRTSARRARVKAAAKAENVVEFEKAAVTSEPVANSELMEIREVQEPESAQAATAG